MSRKVPTRPSGLLRTSAPPEENEREGQASSSGWRWARECPAHPLGHPARHSQVPVPEQLTQWPPPRAGGRCRPLTQEEGQEETVTMALSPGQALTRVSLRREDSVGDSPRRARQTYLRGFSSLKDSPVKLKLRGRSCGMKWRGTAQVQAAAAAREPQEAGHSEREPAGDVGLHGHAPSPTCLLRPPGSPASPTPRAPPGSPSASRVSRPGQHPKDPSRRLGSPPTTESAEAQQPHKGPGKRRNAYLAASVRAARATRAAAEGGAAGRGGARGGAAQRPQRVAVEPAAPPADWPGAGAGPQVQTVGGAWRASSRAAALAVGPSPQAARLRAAPRSPRAAPVRLRRPREGRGAR
ncbi:unnamed protein product [Rangifer tarandus platyrhynchus]|uniref:Uncharacterized protein n=2 Tax=Rangifer tarandus platyrhynchus TaxID=3082113 RepID=A0ABN8YA60_RANTA|nr:unnamed protein product [Rangifer tarandus platyrhynchus]CAI9696032.1 unnamed protein product [Rangifer tarandus platyrhynchus]